MKKNTTAALFSLLGFAGLAAVPASAQWSAMSLHPSSSPPINNSRVQDIAGGQQVGFVNFPQPHAALWTGSAASFMDLAPAGSGSSTAWGTDGSFQAGNASFGGEAHAGTWSGTAASWLDLHPAGATLSSARAISGGQQAGIVRFDESTNNAALWSGSAASFVNLHPAGATDSFASAVGGGRQGGSATIGGQFHASLWTGTADTWQDLQPAGATRSKIVGMDAAQQVGDALFGSSGHASLWTGTGASWVDLNPAGATISEALDVFAGFQAGSAGFGSQFHAGMWNGTAASWEDLSVYLPAGYGTSSRAMSIWTDGSTLYVGGEARFEQNGATHAILWTRPIPEPATGTLLALGALGLRRRRKS